MEVGLVILGQQENQERNKSNWLIKLNVFEQMKQILKEEYLKKSNLHPSDLVFLSDFSKGLNIYLYSKTTIVKLIWMLFFIN